jgi:hypothetical protein
MRSPKDRKSDFIFQETRSLIVILREIRDILKSESIEEKRR